MIRVGRKILNPYLAVLALLFVALIVMVQCGYSTGEAASETVEKARDLNKGSVWEWLLWLVAPIGAVVGLVFALIFYKWLMDKEEGTEKMIEIAAHVREGAAAYLKRQYTTVGIFFVIAFVFLFFISWILKVQHPLVPFAFLTGGFFSGLAGFLGMKTATNASARTTNAAMQSLNQGLQVAFRSGAVMGLVVVGLGLIDISIWFGALSIAGVPLKDITVIMLCFGMGASSQALFARVGGGIFTKAADVGADLVGKVEAGIPEDDPRNPATIADNVGDNVGDVAGMGADLYESYCGSILATAALGAAAGLGFKGVIAPMIIAGIGIALSILGIYAVRTKEDASQKTLLNALGRGVNLSAVGIAVVSFGILWLLLSPIIGFMGSFGIFGSVITGLVVGILIGKGVEYYTSADYKPTQGVAAHAETGPATVIIDGLATGMLSTYIPVILVALGIMLAFGFAGGFSEGNFARGLYGIGIAAVGMLSTLGITLATDAYGPIADNAGGNAEMSGLGEEVRKRTDALDSLGNTTAATGKGFAIGSAALTAMALIAAYIEEVRVGWERWASVAMNGLTEGTKTLANGVVAKLDAAGHAIAVMPKEIWDDPNIPLTMEKATIAHFMELYNATIMNPKLLIGVFIGSMLTFVFCALTMKAVGRAAGQMVNEVRRQFKEIAGIMEGTGKPDYAACVDISTKSAQKEMIFPSLMALIVPILIGLLLGVAGVLGLLVGGLSTGFILAIFMSNSGGSWDNAKKYIETGAHGGKGSDAHKAGVVGDTVGDPFKDTSGPSLNILIKLMSMVSIVVAGLIVKFGPVIGEALGITLK